MTPAPPAASCPLCAGASRRRFARHGFWIRDCLACGHRFTEGDLGDDHVARVYDHAYFVGGGSGYPKYVADGALHRDRGRWYGRLLARHGAAGSVLDVGCAAGFFLKGLEDCGWRASGIEPNEEMSSYARERLGLAVQRTAIETVDDTERFDLVTMIQVIGHFRDPRGAVATAARLLRPGGRLLIETWDRASWVARLTGQRWHEYSPPSVLHWFSRSGLAGLAARSGLHPLARGRPRKRISVSHARSLWHYKYARSAAGRTVDRALGLLPAGLFLPYPGDDLFWMLWRRDGEAVQRPSSSSIS